MRRRRAALPVPGADRLRGAPVTGSCRPRAGWQSHRGGLFWRCPSARPPRGAFLRAARHPAHERRPADHLYSLVCGEGSAAVCYGEPLRGAAPGSEPNSGTTPPSPRSRRYGSPMRVDHSVSHDASGLRRSVVSTMKEYGHQPASGEGFHRAALTAKSPQPAVRFPSSSLFLGGRASWPCPAFPSRTRAKLHVSPGGER